MGIVALNELLYSFCADRDWFRINPLEMVLLGCQSLSSNAPAKRDVSCVFGHSLCCCISMYAQ